jgi:hypothetical protein
MQQRQVGQRWLKFLSGNTRLGNKRTHLSSPLGTALKVLLPFKCPETAVGDEVPNPKDTHPPTREQ